MPRVLDVYTSSEDQLTRRKDWSTLYGHDFHFSRISDQQLPKTNPATISTTWTPGFWCHKKWQPSVLNIHVFAKATRKMLPPKIRRFMNWRFIAISSSSCLFPNITGLTNGWLLPIVFFNCMNVDSHGGYFQPFFLTPSYSSHPMSDRSYWYEFWEYSIRWKELT